jgi:foldase protein PrsA
MRFKQFGLIILVAVLVLVITACGGDNEGEQAEEQGQGEEQGQDKEGQAEQPQPGQKEVQFTEIDRTNLGEDKVVATYEGGEIRGDQLADYLAFYGLINPQSLVNDNEFRQQVIKFLIVQEMFASQAENEDWAKERADEIWVRMSSQYDEETLQKGYDTLQITEEEVKQQFLSFFLTESYFRSQIDEEEIQSTYEDMKTELTTASVRHILVATQEPQQDGSYIEKRTEEEAKEIADDLYKQLEDGADFAELAKKHSEDPGSKENGGLYENVSVAQWVPEFKEAALEQEVGVVGQPVKTDFGYHIIRVEDRKVASLEEIKDPLVQQLANEKMGKYVTETLPDLIEINL